MTDHLPECPLASDCKHDYYDEPPIQCADCGEECFCDRLRACEQRVRAESKKPAYLCTECWHREDGHSCKRPQLCMCRDCNYAAGLDAARDAVARQCGHTKSVSSIYQCDHDRALAAIDALREEKL